MPIHERDVVDNLDDDFRNLVDPTLLAEASGLVATLDNLDDDFRNLVDPNKLVGIEIRLFGGPARKRDSTYPASGFGRTNRAQTWKGRRLQRGPARGAGIQGFQAA